MKRFWIFLIFLTFIPLIGTQIAYSAPDTKPEIIVAAAANLSDILAEIKPMFEKEANCKLTITYGSTGLLSHQIEQGAPYDIFMSADVVTIDNLDKKGLLLPNTKKIYAQGEIVLWQRKDASYACTTLRDLTRPELKRFAIANPEIAPYGLAAKEVLLNEKIWDVVKDKIVYAENIRQTKQYAETGNVDAAIIALALAKDNKGRYVTIEDTLHNPINQALAVIKRTTQPDLAKKFCNFLSSTLCKSLWGKFGYKVP